MLGIIGVNIATLMNSAASSYVHPNDICLLPVRVMQFRVLGFRDLGFTKWGRIRLESALSLSLSLSLSFCLYLCLSLSL